MVELILDFARSGFPLTCVRIRKLAYQYAQLNGKPNVFSDVTEMAGKKWMHGFLRRHDEIRLKTAQNLSINRAMGANKVVIDRFFKQYEALVKKLNIISPKQVWNVDESGCVDVPNKRIKVVGEKGFKANRITSKEQGETTTVLTFANADGEHVPPMVIHKGGKVNAAWLRDAPIGVDVRASVNGWINHGLFLEYSTRWLRWMKNHKMLDRPHILLLDSHKSHIYNIRFIRLMKEFNIHVLAIPPHTSHHTQPLDSSPYARLKHTWTEGLHEYLFQNAGNVLPKAQFFKVFWPAWRRAMNPATIISGFRKTGIFPFNPDAISAKALGPSTVYDNVAHLRAEAERAELQEEAAVERADAIEEARDNGIIMIRFHVLRCLLCPLS